MSAVIFRVAVYSKRVSDLLLQFLFRQIIRKWLGILEDRLDRVPEGEDHKRLLRQKVRLDSEEFAPVFVNV